jgi:hypothetical protein
MNNQVFELNSEYRRLLDKWSDPNVAAPNLLIIQPQNEGVGCDRLIEELAKSHHIRINTRRSFKKCFLSLKYSKDISEQEIRRFFDSPRIRAEHYNRFIGTFCIEISEYLYSLDLPVFRRLMNYVSSMKDDVKYIFIISTDDKNAAALVHGTLRRHLRINQLTIGYSEVKRYVDYAIALFGNYKMPFERGVEQILKEYIEILSQKTSFAGYDTVSRLVDDIVFEMRSDNASKLTMNSLTKIRDICMSDNIADFHKRVGF